MYVCICHNVTEEELERTAKESSPKEALKRLCVGQSCGACWNHACQKISLNDAYTTPSIPDNSKK